MTIAVLALVVGGTAFAQTDSTDLSQDINAGTLAAEILDNTRATVASPSVTMSATTASFDCETSTGTLGVNTERLYASNPGASNSGFTLDLAATGGATDTWSDGSNDYDFNEPGDCTDDGASDTDSLAGQLSVDPSSTTATLTTDCTSCTTTGVTQGSASAFDEGTLDSINLLNAGETSDDVWRAYLTDIALSQSIPAEQPAGTDYNLNLTMTITAQ